MKKIEAVYADNCGACGEEFLSTQLVPVKLGEHTLSRVKVCLACLIHSNVYDDYKEVAALLGVADGNVRTTK